MFHWVYAALSVEHHHSFLIKICHRCMCVQGAQEPDLKHKMVHSFIIQHVVENLDKLCQNASAP